MLHGAHVATVKPGASVSFESDYVAPSEVGEWQDIRLTFISAYDQADLSIEVNTMAGVDMLPTAVDLETSLGLLEREEFTISVKSDVAGVYYLSILVEAQLPDGMTESRAFAQPIRVGTVEPSAQKLEEAEAGVVVLPAHETITD